MPDERLLAIWCRAEGHLERARLSLADPGSQALARYAEFLEHNELGLALEELSCVAEEQQAPAAGWAELAAAAEVMDANDDPGYDAAVRRIREHLAGPGDRGRLPVTEVRRFGQPTGPGKAAVSFRCGACGEMAAVVKAVRAGAAADMGPPLGRQSHERNGIVMDYFGGTAWKLADPATWAAVHAILTGQAPDPAELRRIDWELAPFYCPECGQNYCRTDWHTYVLFDEGFYDCTMGTCPRGHRHMVDD